MPPGRLGGGLQRVVEPDIRDPAPATDVLDGRGRRRDAHGARSGRARAAAAWLRPEAGTASASERAAASARRPARAPRPARPPGTPTPPPRRPAAVRTGP